MIDPLARVDRRHLACAAVAVGFGSVLATPALLVPAAAEAQRMTASGAGVNLKLMPDESGKATVPMRESFAFDASYAQCIVEDNPARFSMDTFGMGRVVIEPHQFFMAMYADAVGLHSIQQQANGSLTATLLGALFCATYAGTSSVTVGSRDATEHARFMIEATDGGYGTTAPPDRFAFTVFFDPKEAPINHSIFGPNFTFTGEMIAGKVTIGTPISVPVTTAATGTATTA